MGGDDLASILKGVGIGTAAIFFVVRFLRWAIEFSCSRLDTKQAQLNKQEARIDASLSKRLDHLEKQDDQHKLDAAETLKLSQISQSRIHLLEQVVGILTVELREADPLNPKLKIVGAMLAFAIEIPPRTPGDMMDKLRGME